MMDKYVLFNLLLLVISGVSFLSVLDIVFDLFKKPQKTLRELTIEAEEDERRSDSRRT